MKSAPRSQHTSSIYARQYGWLNISNPDLRTLTPYDFTAAGRAILRVQHKISWAQVDVRRYQPGAPVGDVEDLAAHAGMVVVEADDGLLKRLATRLFALLPRVRLTLCLQDIGRLFVCPYARQPRRGVLRHHAASTEIPLGSRPCRLASAVRRCRMYRGFGSPSWNDCC